MKTLNDILGQLHRYRNTQQINLYSCIALLICSLLISLRIDFFSAHEIWKTEITGTLE